MLFFDDLADTAAFPWLAPMPIGYVEDGWSAMVADLLADLDVALANDPGAGVDVLDVSEREGRLRVVYELTGPFAQATAAAVAATVSAATARSAVTCSRCGRPGVARRHPAWPIPRCQPRAARRRS